MSDKLKNFVRAKKIDSFQKLRILLFLQQYPSLQRTSEEFAKHLHLADLSFVEKILLELHKVGLLGRAKYHWTLTDEPKSKVYLQDLTQKFDDPITRQELLAYMERMSIPI